MTLILGLGKLEEGGSVNCLPRYIRHSKIRRLTMPMGPGTYGTKRGRPPMNGKKKKKTGAMGKRKR